MTITLHDMHGPPLTKLNSADLEARGPKIGMVTKTQGLPRFMLSEEIILYILLVFYCVGVCIEYR